jgi:hypothetical protein
VMASASAYIVMMDTGAAIAESAFATVIRVNTKASGA